MKTRLRLPSPTSRTRQRAGVLTDARRQRIGVAEARRQGLRGQRFETPQPLSCPSSQSMRQLT